MAAILGPLTRASNPRLRSPQHGSGIASVHIYTLQIHACACIHTHTQCSVIGQRLDDLQHVIAVLKQL